MSTLKQGFDQVRVFLDEVVAEMKKSTWPERQELIESTVVVIVSLLLLAVYVGVCDKILVTLLRWIIPS